MSEVFTREDRETLLNALKQAEILRKELARAKRAGIDVTDIEARLREAEVALKNIQRVYMSSE